MNKEELKKEANQLEMRKPISKTGKQVKRIYEVINHNSLIGIYLD